MLNMRIDMLLEDDLTWSELKILADSIVALLKASHVQVYDPLPNDKVIPTFNPVVQPICPPLKSGPTTAPSAPTPASTTPVTISKATSTTATTGESISEPKVVPANPMYEGRK